MNPYDYFKSRYSGSDIRRQAIYVRIANALRRAGVADMSRLCQMSENEIKRVRDIGAVSLSVVFEEIDKYKGSASFEERLNYEASN